VPSVSLPLVAAPRCTITGTRAPEALTGTDGPDVICARSGTTEFEPERAEISSSRDEAMTRYSVALEATQVYGERGRDLLIGVGAWTT
jgi:hypothetical protein